MRSILLPLSILLTSTLALAQLEGLPHVLTPAELPLIPEYKATRADAGRGISTPPPFAVRTMAEWEEVQTLVITWTSYTGILKQIVRAAVDECEVMIACSNPSTVESFLLNSQYGGPIDNLDNVTYLTTSFNSVWQRDYGAECIYMNEVDSLFLLDWIYNRPRPADDAMADAIAAAKGINLYSTTTAPYDLVHTGGNFMADGFGTAFSSNLVLDENGPSGSFNTTVRDAAGVDDMMQQFMGIAQGRYIKMETLPYDGIHHIDMHMKLLDEETLLIGQFPAGTSDGPQLEQNVEYVTSTYNSVFGTPYRVVRIPMPSSTGGAYPPSASYRTFANNLFLNKTVLVPTYREQYDTTAMRILHESLPGYRIVGIDCDNSDQNIISASGAIHCITKCIGVDDPLLIKHQRLSDTYETVTPYSVDAYIRHKTGIASAEVYWTTDTTAGFSAVPMTLVSGNDWTAAIPAQPAGSFVYYYIHAAANGGKEQVRPIVAPHGWWRFEVLDINAGIGEAAGPSISEVFPNPTEGIVVIDLAHVGRDRVRIALHDATGREVMRIQDGPLHADGRAFADLSALPSGAYLLVAESARGRSVTKLVRR
ncbi:MAG: agmatine deiminase family protein [Flavobacteriales bacterium]|nr:agmatine deiminase family protein [Flavobacteriales bacterium]